MFDDIEVFCTIAKLGGFSKAAQALHISTSMVTRRLSYLEKTLGVRLLQRTTRKVTLTEAGQRYYEEVSQIIERLHITHNNIKNSTQEVSGLIKVGLPAAISTLFVTQHLQAFLKKHPCVKVTICQGNHLLDLIDNKFDFIVHCGELPNSNFYFKKIGNWTKEFVASPEYLKLCGTPKKPEDLAKHNCLDHGENFQFTWGVAEKGKVRDITVNGNVRVNSSLDLANLARHGLGIAYLPSFVVSQDIKSGKLVSVLSQYRPPELGLYMVYPSNQYISQKTRLFMEFVSQLLNA